MSDFKITVRDSGPLRLEGDITLLDEGRQGLGPRRAHGRLTVPVRGVHQQAVLRRLAQPLGLRLGLRSGRAAAAEAEGLR